jgi:hypothetical protein
MLSFDDITRMTRVPIGSKIPHIHHNMAKERGLCRDSFPVVK